MVRVCGSTEIDVPTAMSRWMSAPGCGASRLIVMVDLLARLSALHRRRALLALHGARLGAHVGLAHLRGEAAARGSLRPPRGAGHALLRCHVDCSLDDEHAGLTFAHRRRVSA